MTCKDNFQYVHTDDESFGYCEYCYDDDFYPYSTCGGVQADGVTVIYDDDHYDAECECDWDERFVDGYCTTCGQNCHNCDSDHCIECDFGFWLDHTRTVCIDYCPTGSVYDDATESGMCVTENGNKALLDVTFLCADKSPSLDPVIQRNFFFENEGGYELSGNAACYDFCLYGGANQDTIEFDDPTPIPDRGYWFNGECKFLTLERFVPSLSIFYQAWLKPHSTQGTLFEYSPVYQANQTTDLYSGLYYEEDYVCYESHAQAEYQCLHATIEQFVWHRYVIARLVEEGVASFYIEIDGEAEDSEIKEPSILRIYEEVDFIFGASTDYNGGGLLPDWFFKGFQYTLQFGVEFGDDIPVQEFSTGVDICTCDSWDCPLQDGCLGVCNWNYFWDGLANKCTRCPYWCHSGCSTNGSC